MPTLPALAYQRDSTPTSTEPSSKEGTIVGTPSLSFKSETSSVIEKLPWDGYLEEDLPEKKEGKIFRDLRHIVFTIYHRIFGIVFFANAGILIALFVYGVTSQRLGLITVANIFVAIMMRQDYVVNAFFDVFTSVPQSWPLWFRLLMARVYHLGGIHSGAAVSGTIWLAATCAQGTQERVSGNGPISVATLTFAWLILIFLGCIIGFALPWFRSASHDTFERIHRFAGWTATGLVWVHVVLLTNDWRGEKSLGYALVHSAPMWLMFIITASLALPWTRLRKVPVRSVVLSDHAVRMYFQYKVFGMHPRPVPGSFGRVSLDPLQEWHAFACVPVPGTDEWSMVVSQAGDWTTKLIRDPPSEIWVRGTPVSGVLRVNIMFRRVVFVATGSGIGPIAPCLFAHDQEHRLLWTGSNIRKTFGDDLVNAVTAADPDAVIYDTRKYGRPDMVKLTYKMVKDFNAEAVVIISNEPLTKKVVYGLMSRGVPAFGAIWDS
ncbi:hypothetical protein CYLTODRAFT_344864 [Cylindrobasidium torrendii FP15055 ss-10]|uniref:Nonribosomal peptide synthetase 12 n=1 Tax=Cylindrobasidium torrendii FP15055 ss-10 TaxID=1314674 RepID=A0A0D7BQY4_9AGAR|nr:hypothetical protein CYLTODRAFT_344864 [Cylindrobasidium torrendii FP15055 ss-10]